MGNSLDQYRLVVGMHCVYLALREYRGCFKGKFWCSMLLLFYFATIYLPVLKRVMYYLELSKMNRLWLTQIFLYRFYISFPDLIRLANDVETNPGPVVFDFDASKTICAPYSQSCIRFGENRGKQCVANSLISIVFQHHRRIRSAADMAQILHIGDSLYSLLSKCTRQTFLLLCELPENVSVFNINFSLHYSESLAGNVKGHLINSTAQVDDEGLHPYVSLMEALESIFSCMNYESCLLTVECNTVAILKTRNTFFKIFDSHSRNVWGQFDTSGTAVLLEFTSIESIVSYIEAVYPNESVVPFEIRGVRVFTMDLEAGTIQNNVYDISAPTTMNEPHRVKVQGSQLLLELENRKKLIDKTSERKPKRLEKQAVCRKEKKKNETAEQKVERLKKLSARRKQKLRDETAIQKAGRLKKQAEQRRKRILNETSEQKVEHLMKRAAQRRAKLMNETAEQKSQRLTKRAAQKRKKLMNETAEERVKHLSKQAAKRREKLRNETAEERAARLLKRVSKRREKLMNETAEEKGERLSKQVAKRREKLMNETAEERGERLKKEAAKTKEKMINKSAEQKLAHLKNKSIKRKQNRANETTEQKSIRLEKRREYNKCRKQKIELAIRYASQNSNNNCLPEINGKLEKLIERYHAQVSDGPVYSCASCDQLWYKHSVHSVAKLMSNVNDAIKKCISSVNAGYVCKTCYNSLKRNNIPKCAIANKMDFPILPSNLNDTSQLEWRLVSPRLIFPKLQEAPRGKQLRINGNVVNVPADVAHTATLLPRLPSDTYTIKMQLKRRLAYKHATLSENIRPVRVIQIAQWLIHTGELYKQENIKINAQWLEEFENSHIHENIGTENTSESDDSDLHLEGNNLNEDNSRENGVEVDDSQLIAGVTDTMLTSPNFMDNSECERVLNVAPGEGNKPLSIFKDKYCEELAYPNIFCGQRRADNNERYVPVHYSDICKSELRHTDRRAAKCVENIFFKTKKLQMKILLGKSQIALRKHKTGSNRITAGQLKKEGALEKLMHADEGYRFLRSIRGSPPYFEKAKKDLFAMIRQLGPATLFCSFSAAETKWIHLLKMLGKLVDTIDYTNEQLKNMTWEEKCRLIQSDPVTCARQFDYQVQTFIRDFLLSDCAPLGQVEDWFYRVEFQQRGSPHIHMLIWIKDAPKFKVNPDAHVIHYIDSIITCGKPTDDRQELKELVNRQYHNHCCTCLKKRNCNICRFNYPQPPMRETVILYPLNHESDKDKKVHRASWHRIRNQLNDMKEGKYVTFDELLDELNISEADYILAIRSSLNSPTIFLKRRADELRINNYNTSCLLAWRANMDIQFVLDVYACAMYIVSYISKAQRGISDLLRTACEEAKLGNSTVQQQVRDIGGKFLNAVEISAQEAVYIALQLPMRRSSREVIFVNTSPASERLHLLKSMEEINKMSDDCEDVNCSSLITKYSQRPLSLENVTLADFAALYYNTNSFSKNSFSELVDSDGFPLEDHDDDNLQDCLENQPCDTNQKHKQRKKARIIRSVWFNKEIDEENHFRELLMLFTCWRDESDLFKFGSFKQGYQNCKNQIES